MSQDQMVSEADAEVKRPRKTHGDRALSSLRTVRRKRDESSEGERAQLLLGEAHVLALLDLAEAIRGQAPESGD